MSGRTSSYADAVFASFAKRHKMIKEDFPPGALVMRKVIPAQSKMLPAWEGPYTIVQRSRNGGYLIKDTTSEVLTNQVPACQLRLVSYAGQGMSPDSFEVEKVLAHRGKSGDRSYLIRWKGWDESHDSWVPQKDI
jgi:hypothetical protein